MLSCYERYDEQGRLARGSAALEFACMEELIGRFLAPPPRVVLDVGGYDVHLVDPVPRDVEQALAASAAQPDPPLASAAVGDARSLPHGQGSADAVARTNSPPRFARQGSRLPLSYCGLFCLIPDNRDT